MFSNSTKAFVRPKINEFGQTRDEAAKILDVYDEPETECSMVGKCRFCGMIKHGQPKATILHEDEHMIIIPDIYPEAEAHY